MRAKQHVARLLVLCFSFTLSAVAQLDSAALRAKFGIPLNRETFRMPAGFDLLVDYGANGQVCKLQVPALMPTTESVANATVMKQRMYHFLSELVPDSIRGKELSRGTIFMGANSMISIEYENVMVNELEAGGPFNHDNTITVTFKRDDCRSAVGNQQTPQ
jgi:hypothetical protein